jgi:hypothetical protein
MIYTEDRATFIRDLFEKPPHCARLSVHTGQYTCKLKPKDAEAFVNLAVEQMWETRSKIKTAPDILRLWIAACETAARSRKMWWVWHNGSWTEVRGARLRFL